MTRPSSPAPLAPALTGAPHATCRRLARRCLPPVALLFAAGAATAQTDTPAAAAATTPPAAERDSGATLPAVRVVAPSTGDVTEGSGSYSAGKSAGATGLDLSIRETPQSISVITRERIDDQAMQTVADVLRASTGISIKPVDRGRNAISARGFDISTYLFDGIPFATGNIGIESQETLIYDRVEVVRGSTGLMTGAGDPSAAINLVRKRATARHFEGQAGVEFGSWGERNAWVDLSTPLNATGSVRGRLVAGGGRKDSFIDLENTQKRTLFGTLEADLSAATTLTLGGSYQRDVRNGVLWVGLPYWYADGTRTDWPRHKTTATHWNQWDSTEKTWFARLDHRFDNGWTLRGNLALHQQVEDSKLEWMWGDVDRVTGLGLVGAPYHYIAEPRQTSLGLIATGPFEAWGRRHELTVGLVHSKLKGGWSNRPGDEEDMPSLNTWDGSLPEPAMGERFRGSYGITTETGVYGAARLQLSERLKAIVGARVSDWKRDEEAGVWTGEAYSYRETGVVTPYAGLILDLTREVSAYASYADMFKPQNYPDASGRLLDPLTGKSYELGLKGELLGGALNATAALFWVEQDNYPIQAGTDPVSGQPYYIAAQGTKSKGYELEVSGDLNERWNLSAGWTQFSARDAERNDVAADHPRRTLKLFAKHRFAGALSGLSAGAGLEWQSEQPARTINPGTGQLDQIGQPAYALVDLMARYAFNPRWAVQVNLENALDKTYRSSNFWGNSFTYGEPRKLLVSLDARF